MSFLDLRLENTETEILLTVQEEPWLMLTSQFTEATLISTTPNSGQSTVPEARIFSKSLVSYVLIQSSFQEINSNLLQLMSLVTRLA